MGLPSITNFDISFIERTKSNLDEYRGKYEFTMLLNSLFGMIVVPKESKDKRMFTFDFLSMKLNEFSVFSTIFGAKSHRVIKEGREVDFRKFYWLSDRGKTVDFKDVTVNAFLSRMRHGVAHFGFTPIACPDNRNEWCGVIIKNWRDDKQGNGTKKENLNFEVCLMQSEIRVLADFISQKYLDSTKPRKGRPARI